MGADVLFPFYSENPLVNGITLVGGLTDQGY